MPAKTSIVIKDGTYNIVERAFQLTGDCLFSITIPNSVAIINDDAFSGCSGLASLTIPNSVKHIGNDAFHLCTGLTSIVIQEGNPVYDSRSNCNAIIETASNTLLYGCRKTIIPDGVTTIGAYAFSLCNKTSIKIPNSVKIIEGFAFSRCENLSSISFGNSVTDIGLYAFGGCPSLTSVTFPNSLTTIGYSAFSCCSFFSSSTLL